MSVSASLATSASFNTMLKEYFPYELLMEEVARRNYMWQNVEKDENWYGGTLYVPFEGGQYSSFSFGALTAAADVSEMTPVKGSITAYKEIWGTMLFNEKDLDLHEDLKVSFLKILPGKIDQFVMRMTDLISHSLLIGDWICKLTDTSSVGGTGIVTVDHPERLTLKQEVVLGDEAGTAAVTYYVIAINMSLKYVTLATTRTGSAATLGSGWTVANSAKLFSPGIMIAGETGRPTAPTGFTSLRSSLLSLANGGSTQLYGQTKTTYPYLQALNIDGSGITADNVLEKFFDGFMSVLTLGKGNPTTILCSMKHFGNCAKALELSRLYLVQDKAAGYGWRKISVLGASGEMEIVGIRDMDDDVAFVVDWSAFKYHGCHFFERKRHGDGLEYFLVRATTGYQYIVDIRFYGDLVVSAPSHCGVFYSISY